jgi:hypothetical protein
MEEHSQNVYIMEKYRSKVHRKQMSHTRFLARLCSHTILSKEADSVTHTLPSQTLSSHTLAARNYDRYNHGQGTEEECRDKDKDIQHLQQ